MQPAKILVVDDSPIMGTILKEMIERLGFAVAGIAGNAEEAISKYQAARPDLVLMDLIMPGDSGLVALDRLRKLDSRVAVLMVTAVGQERVVQQALSAGAAGFLRKPFRTDELQSAVLRALERSGILPSRLDAAELAELEKLVRAGIEQSVQAMDKMFGTHWSLTASRFQAGDSGEFKALLEDGEGAQEGACFTIPGGIPFACLILFSEGSARSLLKALAEQHRSALGESGESEQALRVEMANILANSFVSVLGNRYDKPLFLSVPQPLRGSRSALLQETLSRMEVPDNCLLMCHVNMSSERLKAECDFLCVFSLEFVRRLLR